MRARVQLCKKLEASGDGGRFNTSGISLRRARTKAEEEKRSSRAEFILRISRPVPALLLQCDSDEVTRDFGRCSFIIACGSIKIYPASCYFLRITFFSVLYFGGGFGDRSGGTECRELGLSLIKIKQGAGGL